MVETRKCVVHHSLPASARVCRKLQGRRTTCAIVHVTAIQWSRPASPRPRCADPKLSAVNTCPAFLYRSRRRRVAANPGGSPKGHHQRHRVTRCPPIRLLPRTHRKTGGATIWVIETIHREAPTERRKGGERDGDMCDDYGFFCLSSTVAGLVLNFSGRASPKGPVTAPPRHALSLRFVFFLRLEEEFEGL